MGDRKKRRRVYESRDVAGRSEKIKTAKKTPAESGSEKTAFLTKLIKTPRGEIRGSVFSQKEKQNEKTQVHMFDSFIGDARRPDTGAGLRRKQKDNRDRRTRRYAGRRRKGQRP
jgi:hypothetical protein